VEGRQTEFQLFEFCQLETGVLDWQFSFVHFA
jgi:hypothetical protein